MRRNAFLLAVSFLILAAVFAVAQDPPTPAKALPAQLPEPLPEPELTIPAGTTLSIALSTFLNTRNTHVGDSFYADVTYPIYIQQRLVIPRGSIIKGAITQVVRPGKVKGKGRIAVRFENVLLPNGVKRDVIAELQGIHGPGAENIDRRTETVESEGSAGADSGVIAGNAGEGAIIGAISGGGKGAGIGAGAGAIVGIATVLFSRGHDLVLEPGTAFDLVLRQPLKFAYPEIEFSAQELSASQPTPQARRSIARQERRPNLGRRRFGVGPR